MEGIGRKKKKVTKDMNTQFTKDVNTQFTKKLWKWPLNINRCSTVLVREMQIRNRELTHPIGKN